jgi:hypothetical protein
MRLTRMRGIVRRMRRTPSRAIRRYSLIEETDMLLRTICIVAAASVAPMLAHALEPGQYEVGGIQQICLVDDGSWYGTSFPNWGGVYQVRGKMTFIYGNYAKGKGNDSMDFDAKMLGAWTEWRDNFSYQNVSAAMLTFVKTDCDPPPAAVESSTGNPMSRQ